MKKLLLTGLLLSSLAASAAERFLLPVYLPAPVPGAFGSEWISELSILNTGTGLVWIDNYIAACPATCFPDTFAPGAAARGNKVSGLRGDGPLAAVLVVDDAFARQLQFQLRVRDRSRAAEGFGTWLPVVHQSEFFTDTVHLLDIPVDPRYRLLLRAYSLDPRAGLHVRVRIYGETMAGTAVPDPLLSEVVLPLQPASSSQPAYAQLFDFASAATAAGFQRVWLTVQPEGDFGVWGMVSITNNDTQEVTGLFPMTRR